MGNIISHANRTVSLSNGLMDVFIATMGLSGSSLAETSDDKNLIVWLLSRDQDYVGGGTVGFSLCEMPWSLATLSESKFFLLETAHRVHSKLGWERLPYSPNEAMLFSRVHEFSDILETFLEGDVDERYRKAWAAAGNPSYRLPPAPGDKNDSIVSIGDEDSTLVHGYAKCPIHGLFLTCFGCFLCKK